MIEWISIKEQTPSEGLYAVRIYEPMREQKGFFGPIVEREEIVLAYWTWMASQSTNETDDQITYLKEWDFYESRNSTFPLENVTHWLSLPTFTKE